MSNIGMASFAMMYHSPNGAVQILNAEPFIPLNQIELNQRVKVLIGQLQTELFEIIKHIAGEFDLQLNVSCGGDTQITLNMLDGSSQHSDIYQHHNLLGGLTNQLVADCDIVTNNSQALGGMINALTQPL
jgi:hypothetical protein